MANLNIALNEILLNGAISGIQKANNSLNTSTSKMPKVSTCSGIKVSDYEAKCREIAKLLESYKKLLVRDVKELEKLKTNLSEADKKAARDIFKNYK